MKYVWRITFHAAEHDVYDDEGMQDESHPHVEIEEYFRTRTLALHWWKYYLTNYQKPTFARLERLTLVTGIRKDDLILRLLNRESFVTEHKTIREI